AQHAEHDAAAVLLAVIPRRPLGGHAIALEHPVAELAAYGEHPPEKSLFAQLAQLEQAGKPELVLHDAMLDARPLGRAVHINGLGERGRDGLLAVDVLSGGDGALEKLRPQLRRGGVEEDLVRAFERRIEIGGPACDAVLARELLDLRGVASNEERIGHQACAVLERDAALLANFEDRADE